MRVQIRVKCDSDQENDHNVNKSVIFQMNVNVKKTNETRPKETE